MTTINVPAATLKAGLAATLKAASSDATLPVLAAVRFDVAADGKALRLASTDRYSLVVARLDAGVADSSGTGIILSRSDAATLGKALSTKGTVTVTWDATEIRFDMSTVAGTVTMTFRGVDGAFPDVDRLMPAGDVLGNVAGPQAMGPARLAVLSGIPVGAWVVGTAGANKPYLAVGTHDKLPGLTFAALIMPVRIGDGSAAGSVADAQSTLAAIVPRAAVAAAA